MERTEKSDKFKLGSLLPKFTLKNVDGSHFDSCTISPNSPLLVVFTCNHCPYVKGSEAMLMATVREYVGRGLVAVAINSNDAAKYPDDSFTKMQEKAASEKLPYMYLHDESQEVAKTFDAACTPECYLFDSAKKLVYHGAINDSPKDPARAKTNYLKSAIEQLLVGKQVSPDFVHPFGCSIKWR